MVPFLVAGIQFFVQSWSRPKLFPVKMGDTFYEGVSVPVLWMECPTVLIYGSLKTWSGPLSPMCVQHVLLEAASQEQGHNSQKRGGGEFRLVDLVAFLHGIRGLHEICLWSGTFFFEVWWTTADGADSAPVNRQLVIHLRWLAGFLPSTVWFHPILWIKPCFFLRANWSSMDVGWLQKIHKLQGYARTILDV